MEYTRLSKADITISKIAFGGWQASGWESSDDKRFVQVLEAGIERGITLIDTAEAYGKGHSENLIAKAIACKRDKLILASKFSPQNSKPEAIRETLHEILKRLETDYLDIYQQHWPPKEPPLAESIAELEKLKDEGKIRAIGVSNWHEPEWDEFNKPELIDTLQPCYSLLWRNIEPKVLPLCEENKIGVLAYSPLCQGILCGRFSSLDQIPNDPRKHNVMLREDTLPQVKKVLEALTLVSERNGKTLAQTALRWLLDKAEVSATLVGVSSVSQLDENLGALGWSLSTNDMALLDKASQPLISRFKPHQTLWKWHPKRR